ncbi:MAG: hypothetical protein EOO82_03045, partial [Oxalobacteraceae bacterium]
MRKNTKEVVSTLALAIAIAWAPPALAQDEATPDRDRGIQDIVVTATRQATNMQDTPISITAVTAEALEERGLESVSDLT